MEQNENSNQTVSPIIKQKAGQSGTDGHVYRRSERIELRVSPIEKAQLGAMALAANYDNLAKYLRETGLNAGNVATTYHEELQWLQVINRIADSIDHISLEMRHGREIDEDMLLYVLQVQELAEQVWKEAKEGRSKPSDISNDYSNL